MAAREFTYQCETTIEQAQQRASAWLACPDRDRKLAEGTGNTDPRRDVRGRG